MRDGVDASAVAKWASASPSVVGLHPGRDGTIATHTAAGPVTGVRFDPATVVIGVVGLHGVNSVQVVEAVLAAVAGRAGCSVSVSVEARPDP